MSGLLNPDCFRVLVVDQLKGVGSKVSLKKGVIE